MATFRRQYSRVWGELAASQAALPSDLPLAVHRSGNLTRIEGDDASQTTVILVENAQSFEARALSSAGLAVLEVGEVDLGNVENSLRHIEGYSPRKLDRNSVRLLVDGSIFVPAADDEYLLAHVY